MAAKLRGRKREISAALRTICKGGEGKIRQQRGQQRQRRYGENCTKRSAFANLLHSLQRHSVSNAVSNAKNFVRAARNSGGQKVLRFHEIWTSESGYDQ
jgi:hypothetical protein